MTRPRVALALLFLFRCGGLLCAQPDQEGAYVLTRPERTLGQIDQTYAGIPPVRYTPPAGRWKHLPRTASVLNKGDGELRVVLLGDSIVNGTSRSGWDLLLQRAYPKVKFSKVTCVRGSTGCWWYKGPGRVKRYVLDHRPDLLIIGGISQRDDVDSIRDVIRQVRAGCRCDILLMTGAFGTVDPRDDRQWRFDIDPRGADYRARLLRLARETDCAFLDLTGPWGRYVRESGQGLDWF